jgi:hypothetical protein
LHRFIVRVALLAWPAAALLAQPSRITSPIDEASRVLLPRSTASKAQPRYDQGGVDSSAPVPFITLLMKPSAAQRAALERLLDEQARARNWGAFSGPTQKVESKTELHRYFVNGQAHISPMPPMFRFLLLSPMSSAAFAASMTFSHLPPAVLPRNTSPSGVNQLAWATI